MEEGFKGDCRLGFGKVRVIFLSENEVNIILGRGRGNSFYIGV